MTLFRRIEIGLLAVVTVAALPILTVGFYQAFLVAALLVSASELPRSGSMDAAVFIMGASAAGGVGLVGLWMATLGSPDGWNRQRLGAVLAALVVGVVAAGYLLLMYVTRELDDMSVSSAIYWLGVLLIPLGLGTRQLLRLGSLLRR